MTLRYKTASIGWPSISGSEGSRVSIGCEVLVDSAGFFAEPKLRAATSARAPRVLKGELERCVGGGDSEEVALGGSGRKCERGSPPVTPAVIKGKIELGAAVLSAWWDDTVDASGIGRPWTAATSWSSVHESS